LVAHKQLFQRFSRVKGQEKVAEGTGLGLYFVRTVAEKHGGTVDLDSDSGKPTTFSLRLPVQDYLADDLELL
jgi:signal transduction histidine kinase